MPLSFNKLLSDKGEFNINDPQNNMALKHTLKILKHNPTDFDQCILIARKKFQKYFYNDILQLLHVYPLDKTNKDGRLFWSLPKRPPTP